MELQAAQGRQNAALLIDMLACTFHVKISFQNHKSISIVQISDEFLYTRLIFL